MVYTKFLNGVVYNVCCLADKMGLQKQTSMYYYLPHYNQLYLSWATGYSK